jgi:ABC-type sugar transport system substrate-binding protein
MKRKVLVFALMLVVISLTFAANPKKLKIGAIVPTLNAQFWNAYVDFMKKGANELGVDLVVLNCDNKADLLPKYIEDLVSMKVDGMIVVPYWAGDKKALRDSKNSNIPLIFTDVYSDVVPQSSQYPNYIAFVGPTDEEAGYQMAKKLFETMKPNSEGKKVIGWVEGTPGTSVAIDRNKGIEKAIREHPEVVVAGKVNGNFVRDESQAAFESLYQAHPEIKGVWAANGGTATGVMTALKNAGKIPGKDVLVVAMDLNPENVEAVKNGELLFDIGGHWLQGGYALIIMYDWLNGIKIPSSKANIKLDLLPLTKERIKDFESKFPNGVPAFDFKASSKVFNRKADYSNFKVSY